jgi:voltage-gated potassium channel
MVLETIKEMQLRKEVGVIVMAIRKESGEMVFNPPADTAVQGGDYLIVMGRPDNLRTLETLLAEPRAERR